MTKEDFKEVYEANEPNKVIKFVYRFNSTSTKQKDLIPLNVVKVLMLLIFLIGFSSTIFEFEQVARLATYSFVVIFCPLFLVTLYAVIANNFRIRRICRILNLDIHKYNYWVYITYGV
jgi:hypothetical protein